MGSNRREGHEPEILGDEDMFAGIDSLASAAPPPEEQTVHPKMVCDTCGSPEGQCMHFGGTNYLVVPQEQYDALPGEEPETEVPGSNTPELDKDGYPWDARIHGEAKNINKSSGTWRLIRSINKDLVAQVRAETATPAQEAATTGAPDVNDPWVCDQCGVAEGICEHNQGQGGFGVVRKSEFVPPEKEKPAPQGITADIVIAKFIETRDELAANSKAYEAEKARLKDLQERRSMWLNGELKRQGLESFKTASGTCFKDKKDRANVADGAAFMKWVGDNFEENKHFLENRVSKAAVKQRLEDGELAPPGINYITIQDVKIRRA
jgi:hypothetical protein